MREGPDEGPFGRELPVGKSDAGLHAGAAEREIFAEAAVEDDSVLEGIGPGDGFRLAIERRAVDGRQIGLEKDGEARAGPEEEIQPALIAGRLADGLLDLFLGDFADWLGALRFLDRRSLAGQPEGQLDPLAGRDDGLLGILLGQVEDDPGRLGLELSGPYGNDPGAVHLKVRGGDDLVDRRQVDDQAPGHGQGRCFIGKLAVDPDQDGRFSVFLGDGDVFQRAHALCGERNGRQQGGQGDQSQEGHFLHEQILQLNCDRIGGRSLDSVVAHRNKYVFVGRSRVNGVIEIRRNPTHGRQKDKLSGPFAAFPAK